MLFNSKRDRTQAATFQDLQRFSLPIPRTLVFPRLLRQCSSSINATQLFGIFLNLLEAQTL